MFNLLLKHEGYPPAVVFAVLLHGALLWFFLDRQLNPSDMVKIEPAYVAVSTVRENPQRLRKLEELELQRAAERRARQEAAAREQAARDREAARQAEAERQRQAEAQRQAEQRRQDQARQEEERRQAEARRRAEEEQRRAEQRRIAEQQRQQREAEQRAAAERQARAQAAAEAQQVENDLVAQYYAIIHDLISRNWNIPPGARNGMRATVQFRTTPVGDIISPAIVQSSGDASFDRSVLQAIERVDNLQELRDLPIAIYERNFRTINLVFEPKDLLR